MADEFSGIKSFAMSGIDTAYNVVLYVFVLGIVAAIVWIIWYIRQYKNKVIIRYITNQGSYIVEDKAREVEEDTGKFWKLWKMRVQKSAPPPESISITKNGQKFAEAYYTDETGLNWGSDTVNKDTFHQKKEVKSKSVDGKEEFVLKDMFMPYTAQERSLQAAQIKKAIMRQKKNLLEQIQQFVVPVVLVMMFILILIFWEDIYKPVQEQSQINVQISTQNEKIMEQNTQLYMLMTGKQGNFTQVIKQGGSG